ncbi:Dehydrogenase (flavoprotein) [Pedobacter caeni]|uniref:Dehydrogenase (Flavoprotein) n=2 Tax=Pedobacter caeni TaxID=288992 RepID=A0A1M5A757_9SPHI|nr:Dehydrogenase (flavoprotein) [Pedobacter caeni]
MQTDVLIIGGGPAGAATALSLLRYSGLKVTIVEHSTLDQTRVGENVSPALFDLLNYVGIHKNDFGSDSFIEGYSNKASWGSPYISTRESMFTSAGGNYQIDREKFDLHLLEQVVSRGGIVFPRTRCESLKQREDLQWEASLKHRDYQNFNIHARYVVDATGRQSTVSRQLGIESIKYDQLVAIGAFLKTTDDRSISQDLFMEATEEGWWYTAALPNQQIAVAFFTDADRASALQLHKTENWCQMLKQTTHTLHRTSNTISNEPLWTRNAFSQLNDCSARKNFIAVGDAAAAFDPLSSMGIGFALSSAFQAAAALMENHKGDTKAIDRYQQDISRIFHSYQDLKLQFYHKEQRWPEASFWKRRHSFVPARPEQYA